MSLNFGVDIPKVVANAFKGTLTPVTLTRENKGDYDAPNDTYSGDCADSEFTSEGFIESYSDRLKADGFVTDKERKINIIAHGLGTTPKMGDKVTIEESTYTIVATPERDAAGALWKVQGRL